MTLGELKALINSLDSAYDHMSLYDDDPAMGAPLADFRVEVKDNIDGEYLKASLRIIAESGKYTKQFTDIAAIADQIRGDRKIGAIKELRNQLRDENSKPLSLKESKAYIDRYMPMGYHEIADFSCEEAAAKFVTDHTVEWLDENEFKL